MGMAGLLRSGLMQDLGELPSVHGLQMLVAFLEFFERFDDGFGHAFVGLLRAPDQGKFLTRGDAFMAVVIIQTHADQPGRAR